jgi:hypothetical protein
LISFELWTPAGERLMQTLGYSSAEIAERLDLVQVGGSGTFEWEDAQEDFVLLAGFDGSHGVIEVLKGGVSYQAHAGRRSGDAPDVPITVGGQEGDFPASHVLSRAQIFAAVDCLPACERIWDMFEWDSPPPTV